MNQNGSKSKIILSDGYTFTISPLLCGGCVWQLHKDGNVVEAGVEDNQELACAAARDQHAHLALAACRRSAE